MPEINHETETLDQAFSFDTTYLVEKFNSYVRELHSKGNNNNSYLIQMIAEDDSTTKYEKVILGTYVASYLFKHS